MQGERSPLLARRGAEHIKKIREASILVRGGVVDQ